MSDTMDREEIRWKFQIMLENIASSIDKAENERKLIDEHYLRTENRIQKPRNQRLGGIAFIITTIVALISTKTIETFTDPTSAKPIENLLIQIAVTLGFLGLLYYYYIEWMLRRESRINDDFNETHYLTMKKTLIPLKAMVSSLALRDDITKDDIHLIMSYVSTYSKSVDYVLTLSLLAKMGGTTVGEEEFDHERYRETYDKAKSSLDNFKKYNFSLGTYTIEEFVKEFEKYNISKKAIQK